MKKHKRILAFSAALLTAFSLPCSSYADNKMIIEILPETSEAQITVIPQKDRKKISPYIYGINDNDSISGISPQVIKQSGKALSTYNWETNFSNEGSAGMNMNDISLVDTYPSTKWSTPALYTDSLITRAKMNDIPVRLVTLPMMGYVAGDSMGIVSNDELSRNTRWKKLQFHKNSAYLNQPDTNDEYVYIDEYVSYLVNRYGSAADGGINGYFLDNSPDRWHESYEVLGLERITPSELISRSAELSYAVKTIDSRAFVFGPSLDRLQGCINLNNPDAWSETSGIEYSWFIDYYLSQMREEGEKLGCRLLDVLDVHYYTEAMTPVGIPVLTADDEFSNAYRMQAVKTLWNSDYTENSVTVLMNKQFTPLIPTLQASIRINYPGTRLSFSEYDFGGGSNISGAIAQIDALGTFARGEVYLACLSPVSDDYSFQKAALNLFTDYDGNGTSFGDTLVYADNADDSMSSVYAAINENSPEELRIIVTNQNMTKEKSFDISIDSDEYVYQFSKAYTISDEAEIVESNSEIFEYADNSLHFEADTTSVYMLVFNAETPENNSSAEATESTEDVSTENTTADSSTNVVSETEVTEYAETTASETTISEIISETSVSTETETTTITTAEITAATSDKSDTSYVTTPSDNDEKTVAMPVKIIISILAGAVGLGVVYILIFDRK